MYQRPSVVGGNKGSTRSMATLEKGSVEIGICLKGTGFTLPLGDMRWHVSQDWQ